jgi:hypothetical protein
MSYEDTYIAVRGRYRYVVKRVKGVSNKGALRLDASLLNKLLRGLERP